jgi:hypothetical protein
LQSQYGQILNEQKVGHFSPILKKPSTTNNLRSYIKSSFSDTFIILFGAAEAVIKSQMAGFLVKIKQLNE